MKLYDFDGIDSTLPLLPMAARRALDQIGAKLSLEGFLSLPLEKRQKLAHAGSDVHVDETEARAAILGASPPAAPCAPVREPSQTAPSEQVQAAFGSARPIPDKVWQALSPLDRYTLTKVSVKARPDRLSGAYAEIIGRSAVSTHIRPQGGVHMVSIKEKPVTHRRALAECWVKMSAEALSRLLASDGPKGDVLSTARLAGIMATKRTSDLIPLCHPLALEHAEIDFYPDEASQRVRVTCQVTVEARTGVEMEAMVGANIAALTIYDMLKSIDRGMEIGPARLLEKSGGRSGTFKQGPST